MGAIVAKWFEYMEMSPEELESSSVATHLIIKWIETDPPPLYKALTSMGNTNPEIFSGMWEFVLLPGESKATICRTQKEVVELFAQAIEKPPKSNIPQTLNPQQVGVYTKMCRPQDVSIDYMRTLTNAETEFANALVLDASRGLSYRGLEVIPTSDIRGHTYITSIIYERPRDTTHKASVTVNIGKGFILDAQIDNKGHVIIEGANMDSLGNNYLSVLIQNGLYQFTCTEPEYLDELLNLSTTASPSQNRQIVARVEHRRLLAAGQKPTPAQMKVATLNEWGENIRRANTLILQKLLSDLEIQFNVAASMEELIETAQQENLLDLVQLYTYVQEVDHTDFDAEKLGPIVLKLPQ